MTDQTIIAFVLDNPEEAAAELEQLRRLKGDVITMLELARTHLTAPMPQDMDVMMHAGEYAERCGIARGSITAVIEALQK